MVKVLGINASPRKYGGTFSLLRASLEGVKSVGGHTEVIHLYDYDIKPCLGCLCDEQKACRYPCVIEDDMRVLYDKVLEADALIFATPIYWFAPSGVMKNFIDRLTALENMIVIEGRSWLEGKVAGIIAVGNDSGVIQTLSTLAMTLVAMGFMIPPFAIAYFNRMQSVLEDEETLQDAVNVGRGVALLAQMVRKDIVWYKRLDVQEIGRVRKLILEETTRLANEQTPVRRKYIDKGLRLGSKSARERSL